ncbi:MAG TPA: hypothetical protein V6C71_13080 [Coleofasciculaceae cyanobacterium]
MIISENVGYQILELVDSQIKTSPESKIQSIKVTPRQGYLEVRIELTASIESISQAKIDRDKNLIAQEIGKPIDLRVEVTPIRVLQSFRD